MKEAKSCGVLVLRRQPERSFLLMRHADRWDLPKGHVDPGESDLDCALRELREETGILESDIELDDQFEFVTHYQVREKRDPERVVAKTLRIFLGWLKHDVEIHPSEHLGYEWFKWEPPHQIQSFTIDPLLAALAKRFEGQNGVLSTETEY
jgi:bis(5'-nucleosidyl)-tetraphosphatase